MHFAPTLHQQFHAGTPVLFFCVRDVFLMYASEQVSQSEQTIVLIEDNSRLAGLISDTLRDAGYRVACAGRAAELHRLAMQAKADLYIVDLGLPDGDGAEAVAKRRAAGDRTPILIITARASVDDRVAGLDSGADDYLVKPFDHDELRARVRALLRRRQITEAAGVQVGRLSIDVKSEAIALCGEPLHLRPGERRLLCLLARRPGQVVAKSVIETALYDISRDVSDNAVEQTVSRLRAALKRLHADARIKTIWGSGYALEAGTSADA